MTDDLRNAIEAADDRTLYHACDAALGLRLFADLTGEHTGGVPTLSLAAFALAVVEAMGERGWYWLAQRSLASGPSVSCRFSRDLPALHAAARGWAYADALPRAVALAALLALAAAGALPDEALALLGPSAPL